LAPYEVLDQQGLDPGDSEDFAGGPPQSSPHVELNMFTGDLAGARRGQAVIWRHAMLLFSVFLCIRFR